MQSFPNSYRIMLINFISKYRIQARHQERLVNKLNQPEDTKQSENNLKIEESNKSADIF